MLQKLTITFFFAIFPLFFIQSTAPTKAVAANNCVACHAQIKEPLKLSARYFEWHTSVHKEKGVTCDQCHGGNPALSDKDKAHVGVRPYADQQSRINFRNLPANCSSCHQPIVTAFVNSKHYQALKNSGLAPSCATCHAHMASQVITNPTQISTLCAHCHDTINGLMPARPDIRVRAESVMQGLNRAAITMQWADSLLREATSKRMVTPIEKQQTQAAQTLWHEAILSWHTFDLDQTQSKADESFAIAAQARDNLGKKLNH